MAVPLQQVVPELALVPDDIQVSAVRSEADLNRFIDLQYALYRHDPHFVPPLRMERRDFLDASKNPFFLHADVDLFLATRGERVLGRIAVVNDRNYNQFHGTRMATFGLFECVDESGVAKALFQKAEKWARERKLDSLLGPVNLSTNYDCGLLVDGFDAPPVFLMTYNPRYYMDLFEAVGLSKAKDLWAWNIEMTAKPDPKILRIAEKIRAREGVRVRPVEMAHLGTEIRRIKEIYNSAWEKNWGFVPMTEAEFDHMAKDMKAVRRPRASADRGGQGSTGGLRHVAPRHEPGLRQGHRWPADPLWASHWPGQAAPGPAQGQSGPPGDPGHQGRLPGDGASMPSSTSTPSRRRADWGTPVVRSVGRSRTTTW